ncbi:MAG: YgiT-type zinc finger protein [Candidatus Cloacimonetes bacterium]|nr:YgiT-type zinc finger protein [Candidatus Cloacimonadota bacterium]
MKCIYCDTELKPKIVTYNINRKGYDVILHDIPALSCVGCGEIFFEEESVDLIQNLIADLDEKSEKVRSFVPEVAPIPAYA